MKVERQASHDERQIFHSFHCPACNRRHRVCTARTLEGDVHTFNGSLDRPTIWPAILDVEDTAICHSYVTDGRIRFLTDCTHELAGKDLELPDLAPIDPG